MEQEGSKGAAATRPARVELVDNWSDRWAETLRLLDEVGQRDVLNLDEDGWLPARQNLLVAFVGGTKAVGYLCFRVQPVIMDGAVVTDLGRPVMEAVVDGQAAVGEEHGVARQLREAAMHRALELRCARFRWEREEASV